MLLTIYFLIYCLNIVFANEQLNNIQLQYDVVKIKIRDLNLTDILKTMPSHLNRKVIKTSDVISTGYNKTQHILYPMDSTHYQDIPGTKYIHGFYNKDIHDTYPDLITYRFQKIHILPNMIIPLLWNFYNEKKYKKYFPFNQLYFGIYETIHNYDDSYTNLTYCEDLNGNNFFTKFFDSHSKSIDLHTNFINSKIHSSIVPCIFEHNHFLKEKKYSDMINSIYYETIEFFRHIETDIMNQEIVYFVNRYTNHSTWIYKDHYDITHPSHWYYNTHHPNLTEIIDWSKSSNRWYIPYKSNDKIIIEKSKKQYYENYVTSYENKILQMESEIILLKQSLENISEFFTQQFHVHYKMLLELNDRL